MNTIFLIIALVATITIQFITYRYLKWQAIMWLAVLCIVGGGLPLWIDASSDIYDAIAEGGGLFSYGAKANVLKASWGYYFLTLLAGIFLLITSLVKRSRHQIPENKGEYIPDPQTQAEIIRQQLKSKMEYVNNEVGDAVDRGAKDATQAGGPVPDRNANKPPAGGFELTTQTRFRSLGNGFVNETIARLKKVITDTLAKLDAIQAEMKAKSYKQIAVGYYNRHAQQITDFKVEEIKKRYFETQTQKGNFIEALELKSVEQPDWANRTSTGGLAVIGLSFAVFELFVNWWFLKEEVGEIQALRLAAITVGVIFALAFSAAFLFQHLRRNRPGIIRAIAFNVYLACWLFTFVGVGMLMAWRDADTKDFTSIISGTLNAYEEILSDPTNMVLFLVNIVAMMLFYWKFLHRFEKFEGFDKVNNEAEHAQNEYVGLFERNEEDVKDALGKAIQKSDEHSEDAQENGRILTDAVTTLENIRKVLGNEYEQYLHPAYYDKINGYRERNRERRVMEVNPPPAYFADDVVLCEIEEHFTDCEDVGKFLNEHRERIAQADKSCQEITDRARSWHSESADIGSQLTTDFKITIRNVDNNAAEDKS